MIPVATDVVRDGGGSGAGVVAVAVAVVVAADS